VLDEDGGHLFFKCKNVRRLWRDLQLEHIRVQLEQAVSAKQVLGSILNLQEDVQSRVVTLLYVWWSERCCIREGEIRLEVARRWSSTFAPMLRSFQF
jgi:hypothetical protein